MTEDRQLMTEAKRKVNEREIEIRKIRALMPKSILVGLGVLQMFVYIEIEMNKLPVYVENLRQLSIKKPKHKRLCTCV